MTPADVWLSIEGHLMRERAECERTRTLAFNIAKGWADPKKMAKTPQAFMPFDWDKKAASAKNLSPKEIREQHQKMKEHREKLMNGKKL